MLNEIALIAVVVAGVFVALTIRMLLVAEDELSEARSHAIRYRTWALECARLMSTRASLADAAQVGSSITRAPGRLIRKVATPKPAAKPAEPLEPTEPIPEPVGDAD